MSNLRQAYAATAFANLGWSEIAERPIDRVAAAGKASELGLNLWKARYQASEKSLHTSAAMLLVIFGARYLSESRDMCERIVYQCLLEYMKPSCETCNGKGDAVLENGVKIICRSCRGARVKRYTDSDRSRAMKLSLAKTRVIAHKIAWLSAEINRLDGAVNRTMNLQLERQVEAA